MNKKEKDILKINTINIGGCPSQWRNSRKIEPYMEMLKNDDLNMIIETGCTTHNPSFDMEKDKIIRNNQAETTKNS